MIQTRKQLCLFVAGWAAIATALSYMITFWIVGLEKSSDSLLAALGSPLLIAPIVAFYCGRLLMRMNVLNQQLKTALERDLLTDTFNRQYFERMVDELPEDAPACVMMVDIDHFKQVNDEYGHIVGDAVICQVARALIANCRRSDVVARYGGEEFVMLVFGTDIAQGNAVADRIRRAIAQRTITEGGQKFHVSVSIGLCSRQPGEDIDEVLHRADVALYAAKENGRNRVELAA